MQVVRQSLDDILASLQGLSVDWQDDLARVVIGRLRAVPIKDKYSSDDVRAILEEDFTSGFLMCQLFLAVSKDQFTSSFRAVRGTAGLGVKAFRTDPEGFVADLVELGILEEIRKSTLPGTLDSATGYLTPSARASSPVIDCNNSIRTPVTRRVIRDASRGIRIGEIHGEASSPFLR